MQEAQGRVKKKTRSSNLELLRILSMFLIVMSHSDEWTGLANTYWLTVEGNSFIADFLHIGGQVGVGAFLLISGYFMVDTTFDIKRVLRLLGEVWFYTISIWAFYVLAKILMGTSFSGSALYDYTMFSFFPVLRSSYWFVTSYVVLLFLAPFFNKLIATMDKQTYQKFLTTVLIIFSVLDGGLYKVFDGMAQGRLIPVICIYFIAGYIKKYVDVSVGNPRKHFGIALFGYIVLYGTCVVIKIAGHMLNRQGIMEQCYFYRELRSPIVICICVELFLGFLRIKMKNSKLINTVAGTTFGVYLIHQHIIMILVVLPRLFPIYKETNMLKVFIYSLLSVVLVYGVCMVVDLIRQRTVERVWVKILTQSRFTFLKSIKRNIEKLWKKLLCALVN